jgi:IclR family transcriptional regulator, KDG regulon repressor
VPLVYLAMKKMQSIDKALSILELFLSSKGDLAPGDIARSSGLKRVTVHRIISTLADNGFVKQRRKRGKYSLGGQLLGLSGVKVSSGNKNSTISYLLELSRLVNGSVYLTVWYGSEVLLSKAIDYYNDELKINPDEWVHMPLHSSCIGKIILASMNEKELGKYFIGKPLEKNTPNTIVDVEKMKVHLELVKREGIAFENEECQIGVNGVAACIRNDERKIVGAIFIMGSSTNLTYPAVKKLTLTMKCCALKISKDLGYCN